MPSRYRRAGRAVLTGSRQKPADQERTHGFVVEFEAQPRQTDQAQIQPNLDGDRLGRRRIRDAPQPLIETFNLASQRKVTGPQDDDQRPDENDGQGFEGAVKRLQRGAMNTAIRNSGKRIAAPGILILKRNRCSRTPARNG